MAAPRTATGAHGETQPHTALSCTPHCRRPCFLGTAVTLWSPLHEGEEKAGPHLKTEVEQKRKDGDWQQHL